MLRVGSVDAAYGDSQILRRVSLEVDSGQVVCLLGRNGVGKTTTISTIVGFVPVRSGRIVFDGQDITGWPVERRAQLGLALVPQGRRVFSLLNVEENLQIGAQPSRGSWTLARVYEFFPRLKERRMSLASNLSGGEQQMLAIGRAIMSNPSLILMDEPSEGLAPQIIEDVYRVIGEMAAQGMSIVLVEHSLDLAISLADRIYILSKGEIVWHSDDSSSLNEDVRMRHLGVG
jgi:ABC-type branched-subunit amino acid transport system ATPase component